MEKRIGPRIKTQGIPQGRGAEENAESQRLTEKTSVRLVGPEPLQNHTCNDFDLFSISHFIIQCSNSNSL